MSSLLAAFPEKCIGCELCVLEIQRQLKKIGLEGALIRVLRSTEDGKMKFLVDIDPQVDVLDIEQIKDICPTLVFSIEKKEDTNDLSS